MEAPPGHRRVRTLLPRFGLWAFLFGYFFWFAGTGLRAPFVADDLMVLNFHLSPPFGKLLFSNLTYWSTMYRPMGGVVFAAAYRVLGFSPLPMRIFCFGLLLGNLVLVYRLAERLAESKEVALLAASLVVYHAEFLDLYYSSVTIYELLCFAFYLGALCYYVGIRRTGEMLTVRQWLVFLALYIAALDSKETAVSLPLSIGCYEWIWHMPDRSFDAYKRWFAREGRGLLISAAVTVPYIIGKLSGPGSLGANPLYRPIITPARYLHTFNLYLDVLLYQNHFFRPAKTVLLLLIMLGVAVWKGSRPLLFAWAFVLFSVLPFIFVSHYSGLFLYLPSVGWALYAAAALVMLTGSQGRPVRGGVVVVAILIALAPLHARETRRTMVNFRRLELPTREMTSELRRVQPKMPPGAHVFFENDPFPPRSYALLFLVRLVYDDLTIDVARAKDGQTADSQHDDLALRWENGRLRKEPRS